MGIDFLRRMRALIVTAGMLFAVPAACQPIADTVCDGLGEASLSDIWQELVDRGSSIGFDDLFGDDG